MRLCLSRIDFSLNGEILQLDVLKMLFECLMQVRQFFVLCIVMLLVWWQLFVCDFVVLLGLLQYFVMSLSGGLDRLSVILFFLLVIFFVVGLSSIMGYLGSGCFIDLILIVWFGELLMYVVILVCLKLLWMVLFQVLCIWLMILGLSGLLVFISLWGGCVRCVRLVWMSMCQMVGGVQKVEMWWVFIICMSVFVLKCVQLQMNIVVLVRNGEQKFDYVCFV